jgi:transposase
LRQRQAIYTRKFAAAFPKVRLWEATPERGISAEKRTSPVKYLCPIEKREQLEVRLDKLLQEPVNEKHDKLLTFQNRMKKYRQYLFPFLYHYDVPPDNNASERAVRTFKVKQKVSGLFRSVDGAKAFAVIRSVIDTIIKTSKTCGLDWLQSRRGLNSYKK